MVSNTSRELTGKTVLITGAGKLGGQGASDARVLCERGARVYIADVIDDEGRATALSLGKGVQYIHLDVTSEDNWHAVIAAILQQHGRIDALVNNAGIWSGSGIVDTEVADFRRVIEVNQVGVFLGMKAVAPHMCKAGSGSIVNISSTAGLRIGMYYWHNSITAHAYTASKWAVRGMTKAAAMEFAPYNVRVNSIHPGPIETSMLGEDVKAKEKMAGDIPMKRLGQPDEVANLVAFLLSDACPYMSGAELSVDGALSV